MPEIFSGCCLRAACHRWSGRTNLLPLSFGDALRQMQNGNRSLKIADKGIEAARAERDKLNALWYPSCKVPVRSCIFPKR